MSGEHTALARCGVCYSLHRAQLELYVTPYPAVGGGVCRSSDQYQGVRLSWCIEPASVLGALAIPELVVGPARDGKTENIAEVCT